MKKILLILTMVITSITAAEVPTAAIDNGQIQAKIYLPDVNGGFYRGTRFDWSGVIYSLKAAGHDYYGPWFTKTDPTVHDFIYQDSDIIAGPCSAITGPVNEFDPLGFEDAKSGGTFIKIGVGALRKTDDAKYDKFHLYEIADPGKWSVKKKKDAVDFTQTLSDASSGYGYVYRKIVQLTPAKQQMVLRQSLKNTGTRAIETTVYNHNFLVLDGQGPSADLTITVPFQIKSPQPPQSGLAEIRGNSIVYLKALKDKDTVTTTLEGFSSNPDDNQIRVENRALKAAMTIKTDRPLLREPLWSIRSVMAMEPYVAISIAPGQEFTWTSTYEYFPL